MQKPGEIQKVKRAVRKRDGYQCVRCGETSLAHLSRLGRDLEVHRTTPGSVYTVEGCVTLCRRCHTSEPKRARGQRDHAHGPTIRVSLTERERFRRLQNAVYDHLGVMPRQGDLVKLAMVELEKRFPPIDPPPPEPKKRKGK